MVKEEETIKEQNRLFEQKPVALWKWILGLLLLLALPISVLFDQIIFSFQETRRQKVYELELELEKLAARAVLEQSNLVQLRETFKEFISAVEKPIQKHFFYRFVPVPVSPLPFVKVSDFNRLLRIPHYVKFKRIEQNLRKFIPGLKLIQWNHNYQVLNESDEIKSSYVYKNLFKAVVTHLKHRRSGKDSDKRFSLYLNRIQRFFSDGLLLRDFVKFGQAYAAELKSGDRQYLIWNEVKPVSDRWVRYPARGFLCVIDEKELSPTFGLSCFNSRKSGEWEQDGFVLGWINSNDVKHARLPHPFQSSDRKWWLDWFSDKADGVYEVKGLLLSIRRINSRVLAIAAKSIKHLDLELQKKKFLLFFISSLLGLALLLFSVIYRANSGAALSIRWQMLGLFALAVFIPGAGLFYVGNELLRDRRSFYENDAFNKLEKFKKEIEKNREYVFREVEKMGDRFSRQLIELYDPNASEPFDRIKSRQLVKEFSRKANMEFVFVFDSAGEEVLADQKHSSSRKGLLPLVTSLAKLKLRIKGKLAESKMTGAVSLMDLLIEETGGSKMADVQNVLRSKSASAFELKFSDRRSYFFVGEAVPKDYPDEIFVMAFILRDKHFEEVYLRLMAEMFSRENLINDNVQMFFGKNSFSQMDYFEKVNFANPFFIVDRNNADLVSLGRLTEPTRFAGLPVKGSFGFKNGRRALFYSFRPAGIDNYSVAVLYDYQDIEKRVSELAIVLFVVFLVSVLILYVLTRITIRAIITPVSLLKDAVSAVNQGDYRCRVIFPGRDELVSLADAYNKMTKGLDERERMTKYLSRSAIEAVKTAKENVLGGQKVFATILFSDIRSFTTISENHSAEEVVSLLNDYFTRMNQVIEAHDGDIDKFIGDAIMAQFISYDKSYQPPEQMAMKAVKCALQMMKALDEFNRERLSRNLFPIKIGIGLNSGELIAGNIGAQGRMDHTVIGDVVNVASRLEGMSKFGNHTHIVISRSTLDLLGDRVKCVKLEQTAVKGKTQAVEMFEVISLVMSS